MLTRPLALFGTLSVAIGALVLWCGVNKAIYDNAFHAPVSELIAPALLGAYLVLKGADVPGTLGAAAVALYYVQQWLPAAYEADKTDELSYGLTWTVFPQTKALDESTDSGNWDTVVPGLSVMLVSLFAFGLAVLRPKLDQGLWPATVAQQAPLAAVVFFVPVFYIAGEVQLASKHGQEAPGYGTDLTASDVQILLLNLFFVGTVFVALAAPKSARYWSALALALGGVLTTEWIVATASVTGARTGLDVCEGAAASSDACKATNSLVDGYALLTCMALTGIIGVLASAHREFNNTALRTTKDFKAIALASVAVVCGIVGMAMSGTIYLPDSGLELLLATVHQQNALGFSVMAAGALMVASYVLEEGTAVGAGLRAVAFGMAFEAAAETAAILLPQPNVYNSWGLCTQGNCHVDASVIFLLVGACAVACAHPVNPFAGASTPRAKAALALQFLGGVLLIVWINFNFSDTTGALYAQAGTPAAMLVETMFAAFALAFGLGVGSDGELARPKRAVALFFVMLNTLSVLSYVDSECNLSAYSPYDMRSQEKVGLAGAMFAVVGGAVGAVELWQAGGDWGQEEGVVSAPDGFASMP